MQSAEARDLDRLVRDRGPLPVWQAVDYLIQAARGLEAAHAKGIVHHDLKPANLVLDAGGMVRIKNPGPARTEDGANPSGQAAAGQATESGMDSATVDFMAPEQAEEPKAADHRADIYALGCALHYLLTGRPPFEGKTVRERVTAHKELPAPSLRKTRPEVPAKLEHVYQWMMAKRPDDRPASMTKVVSLLESCKGSGILRELDVEDLITDDRSRLEPEPSPTAPDRTRKRNVFRGGQVISRTRRPRPRKLGVILAALATLTALGLVVARFVFFGSGRSRTEPVTSTDSPPRDRPAEAAAGGQKKFLVETEFQPIFDGKTGAGWMLCDKTALKPAHVQRDGINPHGTHSYLVVYHEKLTDFDLEFDYKLDKGCNSGVFLRVSNLNDPIHTGIEVALDDTTGTGFGDSGAFYGLVAPAVNAQKPSLEWNHMTITAVGPDISVVLNGSAVSSIHLDEWTVPGKRPDGTDHNFPNIAIASLARSGFIGFQDLGGNCWFKQIRLRKLGG
jgi:hypothetical protein